MKRCKLRAVALRQGLLRVLPLVVVPLHPPAFSFFCRLFRVPPDLLLSSMTAAGAKEDKQTLTIDVLMHDLRQKGVNIYKPSIIKVCFTATSLGVMRFIFNFAEAVTIFHVAGVLFIKYCIGFRGRDRSSSSSVGEATS